MQSGRWTVLSSVTAALLVAGTLAAQSDPPQEAYAWSILGIAGDSANDYTDRFAGDDMLPYTADDVDVPERGNIGGTWGFAHHDINSDGRIQENEHIFTSTRRDDDDLAGFTIMSRPEYGVLYEAEDWVDYHDARNQGPSATLAPNLDAEGNDFEHNDRPTWEAESNAYLYNNAAANQHGKGKSRYYFEHMNPSRAAALGEWVYDEVEGWVKPLNFQHNQDDPTTEFNERGNCRRDYMRTPDATTRGYLIPVEDLAGLKDGDLKTLFGWETVDLARYFRETIAPKLEDPALAIFSDNVEQELPPTHIMLLQIEAPIVINIGNTCATQEQAQAMADYWGLPATGATYRVCHLLGFNAESHESFWSTAGADVHFWSHEPPDGIVKNLWLIDYFFRDDAGHLGKYTTAGAPWQIVEDPTFATIDHSQNKILATNGPATVSAPLPRVLAASERPIEIVVDLGQGQLGVEPPPPAAPAVHQIIVQSGSGGVVAYAEIRDSGTSINIGGTLADGVAGSPSASAAGGPVPGGIADLRLGEYNRFVIVLAPDRTDLLAENPGNYQPNDFSGFSTYTKLATLAQGSSGDVASVRVSTTGIGGPIRFEATLDPGQEVPAPDLGDPPATPSGTGLFVFEPETRELSYQISFSGLTSNETAAHIHKGKAGEIGDPIVTLPAGELKVGSTTLTPADAALLLAGGLYVNVHSQQNGAGEIRGQILVAPITGPTVAVNVIALFGAPPPAGVGPFVRGDANNDGKTDIADASYGLNWLFLGGPDLKCLAAGDSNGDGKVDIADASYSLNFLFQGGPDITDPYPECAASADEGDVALGCAESPANCQ
jgi:hypothetical protein